MVLKLRRIRLTAMMAACLLAVCVARADQAQPILVTPRGMTKVYVHAGPGTSYPYLGYLKRGFALPLCGEQELYWYRICMGDGRVGYIYAPFAQRVSASGHPVDTPAAPPPLPESAPPVPPSDADVEPALGQEPLVIVIEPEEADVVTAETDTEPEAEPAPAPEPVRESEVQTGQDRERAEEDEASPAPHREARHGFIVSVGAGPGPVDILNDPEILQSFNGFHVLVGLGYDFTPFHVRGYPLVLGIQAAFLIAQAEEAEEIVLLARRAERWGEITTETMDISLGLRFTPLATRYLDLHVKAGPTYFRYGYFQQISRDVIVDGRARYFQGRDDFYILQGIGYMAGLGTNVYPLAGLDGWYSNFSINVELTFSHYTYGILEDSDHGFLVHEIHPKILFLTLCLAYFF